MAKNEAQRIVVPLAAAADLSEHLEGWSFVSAALGYDGRAYVLLIDETPERIEGSFVPTELKRPAAYKALIVDIGEERAEREEADPLRTDASIVEEVRIEGESFNYHFIQPLGEDELLLVGARCSYYAHDRIDDNAAVFGRNGAVLRRFVLGDGIQNVQTTAGGLIWTSYFGEGVFGNRGWVTPIGESGLIAWDSNGIRVFTNVEANIQDCYALNVVSDDEVWFYYYSDFRLCRLSGPAAAPEVSFLDPKLEGASAFASDGRRFLFDQGYGAHGQYLLLSRDDSGVLTHGDTLLFALEDGRTFEPDLADGRGDTLLLVKAARLHVFKLEEWR
ncbi:hypothetical protein QWJ34_15390 [Saccharibacillus sp. CPCC 101409]|uniref:hypothetical protein n=1 Tax=Saccharibacillus sp. CPCC 101409 TaxID=3058041 RepID=UPI0026736200|nr:hypothetical protein [Saccharibacillus sp. CPCC 101409]MDO3411149.1 hypothetical protein [Saccharibacillus sp. CPCC 101409]